MYGQSARLASIVSPRPEGTYRFALRMKASEAMDVTIDALGVWETFSVTTDWEEYEIILPTQTENYIDFYPLSNATLSIEHTQLTFGEDDFDWRPAPEDAVEYDWVKISRDEVTVSHIVDIVGYTDYYLLQKSTLTPPTKPTTNPPPNTWSKTEPTLNVEDGNTLTLYRCGLTEYSDGTFDYTDVSVSTSYEAAKAALNISTTYRTEVQQLLDSWTVTVRATTVRDSGETVADLLGRIEVTEDQIDSLVESTKETTDGLSEQLSSLQTQTAEDITNVFTRAQGYVDDTYGDALQYTERAQTWQRFSSDGIEQGKTGSPFKSKLTNDELGFYENDQRVSYIGQNKFYINNGEIVDSLTMGGNFSWISGQNGLGLVWKGGN